MKETIIIFDGHNLLFQFFYGMPPFIRSKDGQQINAALGFIACILRQIRRFNSKKALVCFDSNCSSKKKLAYPEYKSNRTQNFFSDESANPFMQLPIIISALDFLGIPYVMHDEYEADDVIAFYSSYFSKIYKLVVISSSDTDFLQLVTKNTILYKEINKKEYFFNEELVYQKFNLSPQQIYDLKVLIGDKSDNIIGLPKVGIKTATKLINSYGGVDQIINNINCLTPSLKQKFESNLELINRNKFLVAFGKIDKIEIPLTKDITIEPNLNSSLILKKLGIW